MSIKTTKTFCCDKCKKVISNKNDKLPEDNWMEFEMKFFPGSGNVVTGHVCGSKCFHELLTQHKDYLCLNWARLEELYLPTVE